MKIAIGSDHAGFKLKEVLVPFLNGLGYEVIDKGATAFTPGDDYPDFIQPVARAVAAGEVDKGIVLGMSGQGEAIAANRFKGVRAAVYYGGSQDILTLSRAHNDANVLSLGAYFMTPEEGKTAVKLWLDTPFSNDERHMIRIGKIEQL